MMVTREIRRVHFYDKDKNLFCGVSRDGWDDIWNSMQPFDQYLTKESKLAQNGWGTFKREGVTYFMYPYFDLLDAPYPKRGEMDFGDGMLAGEGGIFKPEWAKWDLPKESSITVQTLDRDGIRERMLEYAKRVHPVDTKEA